MTDLSAFKDVVLVFTLSSARIIAAFTIVPFLGEKLLPGVLRHGIIITLMFVLFPMIAPTLTMGQVPGFGAFVMIIFKEIVLGMLIGFIASMVFWIAQNVGFFIDNQRGASQASATNPMSGDQTTPLGSLFFQAVTVLFFISGGFLTFIGVLFYSYAAWPVVSFVPNVSDPKFALFFLKQADLIMYYTVLLSAPVVMLTFLTDLGLGLINRFAPQLNVFFLAMPIKSGLAIFVLIIYFATLMDQFGERFVYIHDLINYLGAGIS